MAKKPTPQQRRELAERNKTFPPYLKLVPPNERPAFEGDPLEVWRSRTFLVQVRQEARATLVMVNRTAIGDDNRFRDGITWDELMEVKRQIGRGEKWAVECYPADAEVVNEGNLRHLWLLDEAPPFAWRNPRVWAAEREAKRQRAELDRTVDSMIGEELASMRTPEGFAAWLASLGADGADAFAERVAQELRRIDADAEETAARIAEAEGDADAPTRPRVLNAPCVHANGFLKVAVGCPPECPDCGASEGAAPVCPHVATGEPFCNCPEAPQSPRPECMHCQDTGMAEFFGGYREHCQHCKAGRALAEARA